MVINAIIALSEISPEIMRGVKRLVRNNRTPHDIGHLVARHYLGLGAAFYRLVKQAAEEEAHRIEGVGIDCA